MTGQLGRYVLKYFDLYDSPRSFLFFSETFLVGRNSLETVFALVQIFLGLLDRRKEF